MSFFVSKEIEDKVDEKCLVTNHPSEDIQKHFYFSALGLSCNLKSIEFYPENNFKIECESNIQFIDRLNQSQTIERAGELIFKSSAMSVERVQIEKIIRGDSDNYIVTLSGYIRKRGKSNV